MQGILSARIKNIISLLKRKGLSVIAFCNAEGLLYFSTNCNLFSQLAQGGFGEHARVFSQGKGNDP